MKIVLAILAASVAAFAPAAGAATARTITYSGDGSRLLAPITLSQPASVAWTATGGIFMLIALQAPTAAGPNPQLIVSKSRHGTGYLPAGRYRLKIGAFGAWRLRIVER